MEDKEMGSAPVQEKVETAPTTPTLSMPDAGSGYGKKGSWMKWLLIYLVIAVVVYGVIWYFFLRSGTTY